MKKGEDSAGAEFITFEKLHFDNSSPLVMKAVAWYKTGSVGYEIPKIIGIKVN